MASLDTIKRLILRAQAEGFEDVAGKLQTLIRAEDGVVASSERMEKSTSRTEKSWGKFVAGVDPAAKALQQIERNQRLTDAAIAQGLTTKERGAEVMATFERKQIASIRALTPALAEEAKKQEVIAVAHAEHMAELSQRNVNALTGVGGSSATAAGATTAALAEEAKKQEIIATAHAEHMAELSQRNIRILTGDRGPATAGGATVSALQEQEEHFASLEKQAAKQAAEVEVAAAKQRAAVESVSTSIQGQIAKVKLSADEYEKYQAIQKAGVAPDSSSGRLIAVQVAELQGQRSVVAKAAAEKEAFLARAKTGVDELAKAEKEATEQQAAYARQTHEIRSQVEPVAVAEEKRNRVLAEYKTLANTINPITGKWYLSQEELAKATEHAEREFERASRNGGLDKFANGMKLASYQATNLGYQINDVVSGLAMGQPIFTIAAQQGGQLYQILSDVGGGGFGGLKKGAAAAASTIASAFTVGRVAIGGVTAAVATAALAWNSYEKAQKEVSVSLTGLGRASGATVEQINTIAEQTASAAKVSVGAAREMEIAFAQTGRIGVEMYGDLIKITKNFAVTTGQSVDDATKDLANIFADPIRGADELQKRIGGIGSGQIDAIRKAQNTGDQTGAQKLLKDALVPGLAESSTKLNYFTKQFDLFITNIKDGYDFLGKAVTKFVDPSIEQRLEGIIAQAEKFQSLTPTIDSRGRGNLPFLPRTGSPGENPLAPTLSTSQRGAAAGITISTIRTEAALQKQQMDAARLSNLGVKAVEDIVPAIKYAKQLEDQTDTLTQVMGNEAAKARMTAGELRDVTAAEKAGIVVKAQLEKAGSGLGLQEARSQAVYKANVQAIRALGSEQQKAAVTAGVHANAIGNINLELTKQTDIEHEVGKIDAQQQVAERARTMQHRANLQSISAVTQAQVEQAAGQQAYNAALLSGASAQQANKAGLQGMAEARAKDVAAAVQITRVHEANVKALQAENQAQLENAVAAQAAAQHPVGSAAGEAAASAARREAQEKDIAGAREIGRAHVANMQAIVALTTEEKANAAASVAAAGQVKDSIAGKAAAVAAYAEEVAKAAVVQRDFDRNLQASRTNAIRSGQAELQAAQLPIGPGRQRVAGQIEAEAQGRNQAAAIQAQNPNIQIDTSAFVKAAQDVAALGEAARQSNVSLQLVADWSTQAANLNVATAALTGGMDKAAAAAQQVINSGMAQINAQGLEGDERQKAIQALGGLAQAAAANVEAQDLSKRNQEALAKSAAMAAAGISELGVSLKNIVHDTTISASEAGGKTIGSGVTLTGILTQEGYQRAVGYQQAAAALKQVTAQSANLAAIQQQKGLQSQAMGIASPLAGLVDTSKDRLDSAADKVKSAEDRVKEAQRSLDNAKAEVKPMDNASTTDPRLDPYLSRNASVYYGTATAQFFKEISWQDASLSVANDTLSAEQEALQTAQQELATAQAQLGEIQGQQTTLEAIAASANKMAAMNMDPVALGGAIATALKNAGFAKSGLDVMTAADEYSSARQAQELSIRAENLQRAMAYNKGEGAGGGVPRLGGSPYGALTPTPFTSVQDMALKPHAGGADLILPGSGGEQPYMFSGQPGEHLEITPKGASAKGGVVNNNDNRVTQVFGVTDPDALLAKLAQNSRQAPAGYSGAATRAMRLRAA